MNAFSAWAAKLQVAAERLENEAAVEIATEQGRDFIAIERIVTPKKSGALAGSEHIDAVTGGGSHAVAVGGPHKIYAEFRNDGGTINAHGGLGRKGLRPHTLHWDGGAFPLHVTQRGSHYVQRAEGLAGGPLESAAALVIASILDI